tara:strand:+ start:256 stop:486 length:231 start_codon:yes stop_codon:yes gene_type:complete
MKVSNENIYICLPGENNTMSLARMIILKGALRLELLGLKSNKWSAYALIKKELGLKGSRQKVYDEVVSHINFCKEK